MPPVDNYTDLLVEITRAQRLAASMSNNQDASELRQYAADLERLLPPVLGEVPELIPCATRISAATGLDAAA